MFKVYIEERTFSSPQPMEVSPEVPIVQLVPALVGELHLPQDDSSGKRLVYFLHHSVDGRALPEHFTLRSAGIKPGDHLFLESYVTDEGPVMAASVPHRTVQTASFYGDQTMVDADQFLYPGGPHLSPGANPSAQNGFRSGNLSTAIPGRGERWSRRALLVAGGAFLGAAGAGLAYAAYHMFSSHTLAPLPTAASPRVPASTQIATGTAAVPTRATPLLVFKQHQQTVHAVAWSPDGTLIASGASDKQLLIWERNGHVQMHQKQDATIHAVAWSPDGHQLAVATGNAVLFLNAQSGRSEAQSARIHHATVTALAWSPTQPQMLVSAGLDRLAVVWNTQTFRPQTLFRQHTTSILAAGWAADGQTIGTSSQGGVIRIWRGADGQQQHGFFFDGTVSMDALAFEPAGSRLAVGGVDGIVRLWASSLTCQQMGQGNERTQCLDKPQRFAGHSGAIRTLNWSPDGRFLAAAGDNGLVLIWYPGQSQTPLLKIQEHAPILALSWSPDGKTLAVAAGNAVTLWALT